MSEQNWTTDFIERVAKIQGIDAKCRLMRREGFEVDGERFPPYDEYEIRARGRVLNLDAELIDRSHGRDVVFDLLWTNLEHAFR